MAQTKCPNRGCTRPKGHRSAHTHVIERGVAHDWFRANRRGGHGTPPRGTKAAK